MPPSLERTHLSIRIHRFIMILERYRRSPSRGEAYYVLTAIECLQGARHEEGEAAMASAERLDAIPEPAAAVHGPYDDVNALDLRVALRRVVNGEG